MKNNKSPTQIPKVSVCVVTYNQENYIRQCLLSIVNQKTDFDFEVIVSDDCSTDRTRAIIAEFATRYPTIVKAVYKEKNIGTFKNFTNTHNLATAEFVCHCDGDDLFLPDKLQKQYEFLRDNIGYSVAWHRVNVFDDKSGFVSGKNFDYSMFPDGIVMFDKALRIGCVAVHSSVMYRKNARVTQNPVFDALDLFYTWEYLSVGLGYIMNDVLGEYRVNSAGSIRKSQQTKILKLYAHHAEYYYKKYPKQKMNIFIFAMTNFICDLKNLRMTASRFFLLAIRTFTFITPLDFMNHLKEVRRLSIPVIIEGGTRNNIASK